MRGRTQIEPGTRQVLDANQLTATVTATSNEGSAIRGTKWPLLPNSTIKVFNCGAQFTPDTDLVFTAYSMFLGVVLLDGAGHDLTNKGGDSLVILLKNWNAGGSAPAPSLLSFDGYGIAAVGDPLIELASGILITGVGVTGAGAAMIQLIASIDWTNTDSSNHDVDLDFQALLSFQNR